MALHSKGVFLIYIVLFFTLVHHSSVSAGGPVNGGVVCLGCTAVVSISQQLAEHWNTTFSNAYGRLCSYLPSAFGTACSVLGKFFLPAIIPYQHLTPDVICHSIKLCYTDKGQLECKLHPKNKLNKNFAKTVEKIRKSIKEKKTLQEVYDFVGKPKFDICDIPGVKEFCKLFGLVFGKNLPILDFDGDRFSSYSSLQGYSWRGKDCNDFLKTHYPGRKPVDDIFSDSNCNGISGFNAVKRQSWEEILCKDTGAQGTIVLGDSIAAHFHIPPPWLTPTEINQTIFQNLLFVLENEFDWPMMSGFTGFLNQTDWPQIISGPVDSVYKHVVTRNLCNHRDYQNIGKNGADSFEMNNILVKALARNNKTDQPALVFYSLLGNDVCNSNTNPESMTSPEEMKSNALKTMDTLDKMLPNGSHVVMLGLADGIILYETMHSRIHPIGQLRKDVTYSDLYDFLNCLQISPCAGWLNSNATIRNATTKRANELSQVLENIAETHKYKNFDLAFIPHVLDEAIKMWKASGKDHETWQLIEAVDGFHPNQNALALIAKVLVQTMESKFPHFLGEVNPNNHLIKKLFGNQGGYI